MFKIVKKKYVRQYTLIQHYNRFCLSKKKLHGLVIYCREENDRNNINGNDVVFLIIKWVYELIFDFSLGMCKTTARCPLIPSAQQIQEVRKSMQYKIKQPDLTQIAAESEYMERSYLDYSWPFS